MFGFLDCRWLKLERARQGSLGADFGSLFARAAPNDLPNLVAFDFLGSAKCRGDIAMEVQPSGIGDVHNYHREGKHWIVIST
jgi:hypothetical protein